MLKKLLPLLVLSALVGGAWLVLKNPPEVDRSPRKAAAAMTVKTQVLTVQDYPIRITRYGSVQARQRTPLIAEASGRITHIAPELRVGGRFHKDQLLLQLDDSTYQAELAIAKAGLTESLQQLADQQAQAEQARQAWQLSGQPGTPGDRVLRKSQLAAARAQVESARQSVALAKIALDNTLIRAPFDGRVTQLEVEQGQAITSGSEIAVLLAEGAPDIEVSLHQRDLGYLNLTARPYAEVRMGDRSFKARIERVSPELDSSSQQLMATLKLQADITADSPRDDSSHDDNPQIDWPRVGTLTDVVISGRILTDVIVVPNAAVYQGRYVYQVVDDQLQKQTIRPGWQDDAYTVIREGLNPGDRLVITPLGQVTSGTPVTTESDSSDDQPVAEKTEETPS